MIRITCSEHGSEAVVSIAGRLEERYLMDLEQPCTESQKTLILDLSDLQSADREAFRWLRRQIERGVRVTGASPYIRLRLKERAKEPSARP